MLPRPPMPTTAPPPPLGCYAEAVVPTEYGEFRVLVFRERQPDPDCAPVEHVAIVRGEVAGAEEVLARAHSECWTGEALHSLKCDCREQLDHALRAIADAGAGVVLYLRQEGRGIGLGNKIRAYALQSQGHDTVDANRLLGFADDLRSYRPAADMLRALGVRSVALLTNNPAKVAGLEAEGVRVVRRVPVSVPVNAHSREYLRAKQSRMGHDLPDGMLEVTEDEQGEGRKA
jgi:GTP cyclohydrolase II